MDSPMFSPWLYCLIPRGSHNPQCFSLVSFLFYFLGFIFCLRLLSTYLYKMHHLVLHVFMLLINRSILYAFFLSLLNILFIKCMQLFKNLLVFWNFHILFFVSKSWIHLEMILSFGMKLGLGFNMVFSLYGSQLSRTFYWSVMPSFS